MRKNKVIRQSSLFLLGMSMAWMSCAQAKYNSVSMRRSACFGRCPEYEVSIDKSGKMQLTGKRNYDMLGVYSKQLSKKDAAKLLNTFYSFRVDTCAGSYKVVISDLPGLFYTIGLKDGTKKEIKNAHFGPEFMKFLGQRMDSVIKTGGWKKISDLPENQN
jgi:hypothetical protein